MSDVYEPKRMCPKHERIVYRDVVYRYLPECVRCPYYKNYACNYSPEKEAMLTMLREEMVEQK